ncbi:hypothetical protein MUK42_09163 [Musa troglodytarum]|uniref:Uncharacterized protein n=1 Tax=Musa troglodytarum TaxID=320322 RepID=A0A9E7L8N2_9LILI|nr:hypothetical protein MUK42_09163 [Musa troglodytarum]
MASGESQKHLLSLIRNIASEKSQEELRVSDLKKRLLELQNDLNVANADLDGAKRSREMAEQELRGSQVQARISLLQQEILKLRSDLDALNMHELEAEYEKERHDHDKVCEELAHVERRWFLVTAIMEETKQLQELAEYPSWFYDYVNMHSKRMHFPTRLLVRIKHPNHDTYPLAGLNNLH